MWRCPGAGCARCLIEHVRFCVLLSVERSSASPNCPGRYPNGNTQQVTALSGYQRCSLVLLYAGPQPVVSEGEPSIPFTWYRPDQSAGPEALDDRSPQPDRVWNRIPDAVRERIKALALDCAVRSVLPLRTASGGGSIVTVSVAFARAVPEFGYPALTVDTSAPLSID